MVTSVKVLIRYSKINYVPYLLYTFSARKSWFRECLGQPNEDDKGL